MVELKGSYFFCYSYTLHKFVHNRHKIKFICTGKGENDNRKFWVYEHSDELSAALTDYKEIFK